MLLNAKKDDSAFGVRVTKSAAENSLHHASEASSAQVNGLDNLPLQRFREQKVDVSQPNDITNLSQLPPDDNINPWSPREDDWSNRLVKSHFHVMYILDLALVLIIWFLIANIVVGVIVDHPADL